MFVSGMKDGRGMKRELKDFHDPRPSAVAARSMMQQPISMAQAAAEQPLSEPDAAADAALPSPVADPASELLLGGVPSPLGAAPDDMDEGDDSSSSDAGSPGGSGGHPVPEMTLNLLADDPQTGNLRRLLGPASVRSKMASSMAPRAAGGTTGFTGGLLGSAPTALSPTPRGSLRQLMQQSSGDEAAGDDEAGHEEAGDEVAGTAATGDPTAASSSARAADATHICANALAPAAARGGTGVRSNAAAFLEPDLTLDDFAVPPELPPGSQHPDAAQQAAPPAEALQHAHKSQPQQAATPFSTAKAASLAHSPYMAAPASAVPPARSPFGRPPDSSLQLPRSPASAQCALLQAPPLSPYSVQPSVQLASALKMQHQIQMAARSPYVGAAWRMAAPPSEPRQHGGLLQHPAQQQQAFAAAVATAAPPAPPPQIHLPEFLQLVEIRFLDDMRRRTSIIHAPLLNDMPAHADGGPSTAAEVLDALYVAGPRMALTQRLIDELAAKVEDMQARMAQLEASMARANPPIFGAVQTAGPGELHALQDHMKLLKRVCRLRNLMAWKQQRIGFEQELGMAYRASMEAVQAEIHAADDALSGVARLEDEAGRFAAALAVRAQRDTAAMATELEAREARGAAARQLEELRTANAARASRVSATSQRLASLKVRSPAEPRTWTPCTFCVRA
eukprot:364779-Chlamydomonas_euryale.AAC.8